MRAVVESMAVGALCVFLGRGIKTAESKISRRVLTEDEALSIFVPFIFIIASLSGSEIFGVSLKMFLSVFWQGSLLLRPITDLGKSSYRWHFLFLVASDWFRF